MQFTFMIKSLALAIITFSAIAVGAAVDKATYLANLGVSEEPKYTFGKAIWKGNHNGKYYELEGNVGEVIDQLEVLDPGSTATLHASVANSTTSTLSPRNKSDMYCIPVPGQNWQKANQDSVSHAAEYLHSLEGCLSVAARNCVNIACWPNPIDGLSGIYQCNDNDFAICPGADYLGSYADDINNVCSSWVDWSGRQEFDTDGYNVIAKHGCDPI